MHRGSLAALLLAGTAASTAFGQDAGGGLITATISERLEADSNYRLDDPSPGTSYFADTRLSFGYLNETPTQTFGLGLSTAARALWEAEEDFDFTLGSPTGGSLDYTNEWANAAFDAAFDYRQRLVNVNYFEEIDTDGDLLARRPEPAAGRHPRASHRRQCRAAARHRRPVELRAALHRQQHRLQRDRHQPDAALHPRGPGHAGSCG